MADEQQPHFEVPFAVALRQLMAERKISTRALERITRTAAGEDGFGHTYVSALQRGALRPTTRNMEVIAQVFDIDPRAFLEYRQHLAAERAREMVREMGLDEVLAKLDELEEDQ